MDRSEIQKAAIARFAAQGYHATTLRELASDLNVTGAAFYHHYRTKDELLFDVVQNRLRENVADIQKIRKENPEDAVSALVYWHVYSHCMYPDAAIVINREPRYMAPKYQRPIRKLLGQYQCGFHDAIELEYDIAGDELVLATKGVLALGILAAGWFRPDGRLDANAVATINVRYAGAILREAAHGGAGAVEVPVGIVSEPLARGAVER